MLKKLTLLSFALSGLLLAQPPATPRTPGARAGVLARRPALPGAGLLKKELNLTDEQVKQIQDLRRQQAEQLRPLREQIAAGAKNLRTLMQQDNPDPLAVGRQMVDLKKMRQDLAQSRDPFNDKVKAILTPEQQQKLDELRKSLDRAPVARRARALGLIGPRR